MKVTIYGSGYVGLVTGACLAKVGNNVLCVDIDPEKIERLQRGDIPIYEPGLDKLIGESLRAGRLKFTLDAAAGAHHGLFQFIAVGTPPEEDGSADLHHVLTVARTIAEHMDGYRMIINKSTVPVGTADRVRAEVEAALSARGLSLPFDVVSNPEFLKEGAAIDDFMKPDRVIVGTDNSRAIELMEELYAPFNRNHERMLIVDTRSAELTKYAANAMLATKISFMNSLANIAERVAADIEQVRIAMGSDPRIGYHFIYPGCGYGGSCFPKDVKALGRTAEEAGSLSELLSAVENVNNHQKHRLFEKIHTYFNGNLKGRTIALWGLAFKSNTDDMREASSRVLMADLWSAGARIRAYDPVAMDVCRGIYGARPDLTLCTSREEPLAGSDALAIVTEWNEFRSPDFAEIRSRLKNPVIFDGRNLYDPRQVARAGIGYYAIGRGLG